MRTALSVEQLEKASGQVLRSTNGEHEAAQRRKRLVVLDTAKMLSTDPPPVDWLAEGVVARGTLTLFAGREKEGKSLVCQAIAATMASGGGSVAGIECCAGKVLVVDAENGSATIHRRIHGLGLHRRHAMNLIPVEAWGFDLRKHLGELDEVIRQNRPDLVILDSFRSLWAGKENDADEAAAVVDPIRNLARKRDVGMILIHHANRVGGYRGSSAIGASVENILGFVHLPDDPERSRRRLRNEGCRYAEAAPDRWLVIGADKRLGVIFVDEAEPFESPEEAPTARAPVREELSPRVLAALSETPQTLADVCRSVGRGPKDASVRRVLDALAQRGEAAKNDAGRWVIGEGCQVSAPIGPGDTLTPDTPPAPVELPPSDWQPYRGGDAA